MEDSPVAVTRRRFAPVLVIGAAVFVIVAYVFFSTSGFMRFPDEVGPRGSFFAALGEGFLHGHTYLAIDPDPRLLALEDPYDPNVREGIDYMWDASLYKGKYYLYFSPLPAILFYLPYRVIRGAYPPDILAGMVFGVWTFLACVATARRALRLRTRTSLFVPLTLWVLFIGFANLIPFIDADVRVYEVSELTGAAMTATWAYALVRMIESPTRRRVIWTAIWLGLAIAARPNLAVLLVVSAATLWLIVSDGATRRRLFAAASIPLAVVALAMLSYNYARFHRPFQFGTRYQLTAVDMKGRSVCRLCNVRELSRFANSIVHYVFWPISIRSTFPFIHATRAQLDPRVSFPGNEEVIGIGPGAPLTLVATALAALLVLTPGTRDKSTVAGLETMLGSWLIIFGLSACWYVVVRYEIDFMPLMTAATVVCVENGLAQLSASGVRVFPLRVGAIALTIYSICAGLLLGFVGREEAFRTLNPDLFHRLAAWFGSTGF